MVSNRTAFVDAKDAPIRVGDSEIPKPGADDIVVRNFAVAINTNDPARQAGFLVKEWPTVPGHDLAGEVHAVGSNVTRFKKGDRVLGHAWQFLTGKPEDGAFNLYTRVPAGNAALLPENISYAEGAVLPLAIDTAARGLYGQDFMNLEFPSLTTARNSKDKVVVVYGGSSSVGLAAIQLAVNAGYRVIATASPKNFGLVRQGGASEVFDYKSASIAEDVATAVGKSEFMGLYNAIGIPESFEVVTPIMERLGGGFVANTKPPGKLPESIRAAFTLGIGDYSFPIWKDFVGQALAEEKLKALPPPKIVGKGLESLQDAFTIRDGDVNGVKIVVEL